MYFFLLVNFKHFLHTIMHVWLQHCVVQWHNQLLKQYTLVPCQDLELGDITTSKQRRVSFPACKVKHSHSTRRMVENKVAVAAAAAAAVQFPEVQARFCSYWGRRSKVSIKDGSHAEEPQSIWRRRQRRPLVIPQWGTCNENNSENCSEEFGTWSRLVEDV